MPSSHPSTRFGAVDGDTGPAPGNLHVWCSSDQAELVATVLAALGPTRTAVCGIDGTQTGTLATALELEPLDDPRLFGRFGPRPSPGQTNASTSVPSSPPPSAADGDRGQAEFAVGPPGGVVWLAADSDLPPAAIRALAGQAPLVLTALPSLDVLSLWSQLRFAGTLRWWLRRPDRAPLLAEIGTLQAVHLELGAATGMGGLGWRLFDAVDAALSLLEPIETVAASIVDGAGRPLRPTGLRQLSGTLGAIFKDRLGRPVTAAVSTAGGLGQRALLIGDQGVLRLDQGVLHWLDRRGREIDRVGAPALEGSHGPSGPRPIAEAIREVQRGEDAVAGLEPPLRSAEQLLQRLAVCEAVRLSTLTGTSESVESVMTALGASSA